MTGNFVQDSLIIGDGQFPTWRPMYAGSRDGRYVFAVDEMEVYKVVSEGGALSDDYAFLSIDIFDLFLAKRTRIGICEELYSFGKPCGMYSLDETTLVLISVRNDQGNYTVRQWLLNIDLAAEKVRCPLYRMYAVDEILYEQAGILVGDHSVLFTRSCLNQYILPRDPLSTEPHRHLRPVIRGAHSVIRRLYANIYSSYFKMDKGFWIKKDVMGFFIKQCTRNGYLIKYDLSRVAVIDLSTGSVYLQEVSSSVSAHSLDQLSVGRKDIKLHQTSDGLVVIRAMTLNSRQTVFFASFNTRFLHITEIEACNEMDLTESGVVSFSDGIIVADRVEQVDAGDRLVGKITSRLYDTMDRFRLVRDPLSLPSLTRLASIAVQRSGRVDSEQMQQIIERIN